MKNETQEMLVSIQFYMDLSQFIWASANKKLHIVRLKVKRAQVQEANKQQNLYYAKSVYYSKGYWKRKKILV